MSAAANPRIPVILLPEEHSTEGTKFNMTFIPYFTKFLTTINRKQVLNFSEGDEVNEFFNELHKGKSTISMIEQKETQPDIKSFKDLKMALALLNILGRELDGFRSSRLQNPKYVFPQIDGNPSTERYLENFMIYNYKMNQVYSMDILGWINTAWLDIFRGGERSQYYESRIKGLLKELEKHFATRDNPLVDYRQMIIDLQKASETETPLESRKTVNVHYRRLIRDATDTRNIRKIEAFIALRNTNLDSSKHVVLVIMDIGVNHYNNLSNLITSSSILVREPEMTQFIEKIYNMGEVSLNPRERERKTRSNRRKTQKQRKVRKTRKN